MDPSAKDVEVEILCVRRHANGVHIGVLVNDRVYYVALDPEGARDQARHLYECADFADARGRRKKGDLQ